MTMLDMDVFKMDLFWMTKNNRIFLNRSACLKNYASTRILLRLPNMVIADTPQIVQINYLITI